MEVARLKAVLEAETAQAEADLRRAAGAVDQTGAAAGRGTRGAQIMGRAFQAAGATAGYAFGAGIESAATFEDGLRTINTIAGLSDEQLAGLGDQIQQVSRDTGRSTEDLTAAYYDLLSAGTVAGDDITGGIEALRTSATLSIGALSTTGEAVDLVTTALNAWGLGADQAGRATDIFATAVERGKVTASGIASSLANAAPLAASMGIEMEEVAASYATLTARGVPASEAMTQMNAAMRALINPNERLNAIQERTGINFAKLAEEQGLQVALQTLRDVTADTAGPLEHLSTVTGKEFPDALKAMQDELGLTNSQVETLAAVAGKDGVGAAMSELTAEVGAGDSALAEALGRVEGFNFVLQTTDGSLGDATDAFAQFSDVMRKLPAEAGPGADLIEDLPDVVSEFADNLGLSQDQVDEFIANVGEKGVEGALAALRTELGEVGGAASVYADNLEYAQERVGIASEQAAEKMKSPTEQAARLTAGITTFLQDVAGPFANTMGPVLLTLNNLGPAFLGPLSPVRLLGSGVGWLATKGVGGLVGGLGKAGGALARFGDKLIYGAAWMSGFSGAIIKDGLTALGNFVISTGKAIGKTIAFGATLIAQGVANVAKFAASLIMQGIAALGTFILRIAAATGAAVAFGAALLVRAITAVAAFAGALLVQGIGALIAFAGTVFSTAIPAIVALAAPFLPIILIIGAVVGAIALLFVAWENNFLGIRDIATNVWNFITGLIGGAIDFIVGVVSGFIDFIAGIWNGVTEKASGVWDAITGVIGAAVGVITGIIGGIVDVAQGVWDAVSGIFGAIGDAAAGAADAVGNVVGGVGDVAGGVWDFATGWIPSFQEGTLDTGRGGLAFLHPREAVLPAEVASALRGWLGSGAMAITPQRRSGGEAGETVIEHLEVNVPVHGLLRAETPKDVVEIMRRAADLGYIIPRKPRMGT